MEEDDDARSRTAQVREGMGSKITFLRRPSSSLEGPPICTLPATENRNIPPQAGRPGGRAAIVCLSLSLLLLRIGISIGASSSTLLFARFALGPTPHRSS